KGLEVVLASGEIVNMGGKLLKNNTGLDLMHLMIGSEGILGIITRVIFRLYPRFGGTATLVISWDDRHQAIETVPKILQSGAIPLALEYVERDVIQISADKLGLKWPPAKGTAHLIVIVTGASEDDMYSQCQQISDVCEKSGAVDTLIAETKEEQADILKIRSEMYPSLKPSVADVLDVAVPPAEVANFMDTMDRIGERFDTRIITYGHAGDGNLHPHLMMDLYDRGILKEVKQAIYTEGARMGGVITAEHGIGKVRIDDLGFCIDMKSRELMQGIKRVFDPSNILNPGAGIG
ncbi:MAG: FAD-binding oxidoreductase, partial [Dehalococcoidia bacterium]|nr:FAD-binding oxidoreductase [Dehalococcoidia bacterium]